MLDIGWTELLVIAIVLIVVVGPKDLPPMLRAFGKMTSNLRKMAGEFRTQFDEALRESDLDDVRKTIGDAQRLNPTNALREAINPLRQMGQEIKADLQRSTQVPTPAAPVQAGAADVEAQQAIEGAGNDLPKGPEVPSAVEPVAAVPVPSVATAPIAPIAAASPAAAGEVAPAVEKPKRVRKASAPVEASEPLASDTARAPEPVAKPKRTRTASASSPVAAPAGEVVAAEPVASKPRRRVVKKTETPKDDA